MQVHILISRHPTCCLNHHRLSLVPPTARVRKDKTQALRTLQLRIDGASPRTRCVTSKTSTQQHTLATMAIQDFSGDLSPSMSDVTRDVVPIIPPSFHDEAFLPQISLPASISYRSSLKKRKLSTARVEKSRSVCTSRQRAATMSDSEADKKRNKLGYQRISIACGMTLLSTLVLVNRVHN